MPSPFPGMDPYLENQHWGSFHSLFVTEIARQLAAQTGAGYYVLVTERFNTEITGAIGIATKPILPDVALAQDIPWPSSHTGVRREAPLVMDLFVPEREPQFTVEIHDAKNRELITAIEVLSPTNKRNPGREEYLEKRARIIFSTAHLLEIDLLRGGIRVPTSQPLPNQPYFILLSRANLRPKIEIWPISLREPLPPVSVPLQVGDDDLDLNLQTAFTTLFDLFRYGSMLNYGEPLSPLLKGDDALWAAERIKQYQQ